MSSLKLILVCGNHDGWGEILMASWRAKKAHRWVTIFRGLLAKFQVVGNHGCVDSDPDWQSYVDHSDTGTLWIFVIHNAYEIWNPNHMLKDRRNVDFTKLIPKQEWRSEIIQALPFTCNGNDLGKEDLHLWRPDPQYEIALQSQHLQTPSRHLEQVTKNTPLKPSIIAGSSAMTMVPAAYAHWMHHIGVRFLAGEK